VGSERAGEPAPGVALVRADDESVVRAAPEPPRPKPPPKPPDIPSPRPTEGSRPRLRPDDPTLKPNPRSTPAETETPSDAERLTARIGLLDGPMPTPPPTPTPGSRVVVAAMHPFRILPPLSHVPVIELLNGVGIRSLTITVNVVGIVIEGNSTPAPAPTVTDAATVAERLTPIGILGTRVVNPGRADSRVDTPSTTAPGT